MAVLMVTIFWVLRCGTMCVPALMYIGRLSDITFVIDNICNFVYTDHIIRLMVGMTGFEPAIKPLAPRASALPN